MYYLCILYAVIHSPSEYDITIFLCFFSFGAEGATSKLSAVQYDISLTLKP